MGSQLSPLPPPSLPSASLPPSLPPSSAQPGGLGQQLADMGQGAKDCPEAGGL